MIQAPEPGPRIMRYELADYEWTAIRPFLPTKQRGVPRVDDRRVLNGIFWILRSGAPWRDLPENIGPYPQRRARPATTAPVTIIVADKPSQTVNSALSAATSSNVEARGVRYDIAPNSGTFPCLVA